MREKEREREGGRVKGGREGEKGKMRKGKKRRRRKRKKKRRRKGGRKERRRRVLQGGRVLVKWSPRMNLKDTKV